MLGNPRHQQAVGEERSLQIRNKKEKSALVANRGGVLGLPKVKVPIRAIGRTKKPELKITAWKEKTKDAHQERTG